MRGDETAKFPLPSAAYIDDEGDLYFEWVYDNGRAAIWIDPNNTGESGWYMVTKDDTGEGNKCGNLDTLDTREFFRFVSGEATR